jgi:hypothetical protein
MPLITTHAFGAISGPTAIISNTGWDPASRTGVFFTGNPGISTTDVGLVPSQNIAPGGMVFTDTFVTSGKYYFETGSGSASGVPGFSIGIGTADAFRGYNPSPGTATQFYPYIGGGFNGDVLVNGLLALQTGLEITLSTDLIGIAYDADNDTVSYYVNGVLGGTVSFIANGPAGPFIAADESGTNLDITAAWSSPFAFTPPIGFTPWP